jgi:pectin methylesterase-like acyl-CoA thioesterase
MIVASWAPLGHGASALRRFLVRSSNAQGFKALNFVVDSAVYRPRLEPILNALVIAG